MTEDDDLSFKYTPDADGFTDEEIADAQRLHGFSLFCSYLTFFAVGAAIFFMINDNLKGVLLLSSFGAIVYMIGTRCHEKSHEVLDNV